VIREWQSDPFTMTVKRVCGRCNNGWMNDLEISARRFLEPMIDGIPQSLDANAQATVASWVAKTAMMLGLIEPDRPVPPGQYRELLHGRRPPANCLIWAAAYMPDEPLYGSVSIPLRLEVKGPSTTVDSFGYVVTLQLGHIAFQVFGYGTEGPINLGSLDHGYFQRYLTSVWPATNLVNWPPPLALTGREQLNALARRWA
jgi:hypothetical protein